MTCTSSHYLCKGTSNEVSRSTLQKRTILFKPEIESLGSRVGDNLIYYPKTACLNPRTQCNWKSTQFLRVENCAWQQHLEQKMKPRTDKIPSCKNFERLSTILGDYCRSFHFILFTYTNLSYQFIANSGEKFKRLLGRILRTKLKMKIPSKFLQRLFYSLFLFYNMINGKKLWHLARNVMKP